MADVDRAELVAYLGELLAVDAGEDYCPNGLQVEGRARISLLVTGVTACRELLVEARSRGADAVLVHHGIYWNGQPQVLVGPMLARVRELVEGGMSLLAYHLPLDRHPELGNNVLGARGLGLVDFEPFAVHRGLPVGFRGRFPVPVTVAELVRRCRELYEREPLLLGAGPDPVRTLGIVSGGAQSELRQAIEAGLDAYLTGEASEWVTHAARESGLHYVAAGHHATERLGVRALGEHLAARFGIEVAFVDVPNPV